MEGSIEIPLSKNKLILLFLAALIFVIIGFWFVISPPESNHSILGNKQVIFIIGLVSIVFFGILGVVIFRKFLDNTPGIIINEKGITDNSSGVSIGFIPWSDIQDIKTTQVLSEKFVTIVVKNPKDYIEKKSNSFRKRMLEMNFNKNGSPISISPNTLKMNFNDLHRLLFEEFIKHK